MTVDHHEHDEGPYEAADATAGRCASIPDRMELFGRPGVGKSSVMRAMQGRRPEMHRWTRRQHSVASDLASIAVLSSERRAVVTQVVGHILHGLDGPRRARIRRAMKVARGLARLDRAQRRGQVLHTTEGPLNWITAVRWGSDERRRSALACVLSYYDELGCHIVALDGPDDVITRRVHDRAAQRADQRARRPWRPGRRLRRAMRSMLRGTKPMLAGTEAAEAFAHVAQTLRDRPSATVVDVRAQWAPEDVAGVVIAKLASRPDHDP